MARGVAAARTVIRALVAVDPRLPRRALLGGGLAAMTLLTGLALLGLSGWFITASAAVGLSLAAVAGFNVFTPSAGIRLLALGRTASRYGERLVTHDATLRALAALRGRLFRGWSAPEAARKLLARPARLLFRLSVDVDALDGLLLRMLMPAGLSLLAALVAGGVLAVVSPWAGLLLGLGLITGQAWLVAVILRRGAPIARRRVAALEALRMRTIDLVSGQVDLRLTGQLEAARASCLRAEARLATADDAQHRLEVMAGLVQAAMMAIATIATFWVLAGHVQAGTLGLPLAAAVLFVLIASAEPMTSLRRGAVDAARVLLAARRVAPRLQADAPGSASGSAEASPSLSLSPSLSPSPSPSPSPSLSLSRTEAAAAIAARCDAIEVAPARLQAVSLQVPVGETVAILGASGAGKSTLLAVLAGELAPTRGTWQALPATRFLQRTELFQDSLRDNLRLVEPNASDARLWTALDAAGLIADVAAMPQGIDTRLGDGGLGLSSGQSRRLALARLVLTRTPLWLLDEPTEGLDARTARDVLRRLRECARGRTVLMATHLRREAAQADRLVWMDGGRIVADCSRGESRFDSLLESLRPD